MKAVGYTNKSHIPLTVRQFDKLTFALALSLDSEESLRVPFTIRPRPIYGHYFLTPI